MAMNYQITTDSTCDLPVNWYAENQVGLIALEYLLDGKTYQDYGPGSDSKAFYDRIRSGAMPTTSMVNMDRYMAFFEPYLKEGLDIYHISFSAGLSGSYQCAVNAALELAEKYPERKIYVSDSACASMGHGLLVYTACAKRDAGMELDDLHAWLEGNKLGLNHLFTVDNLMHLHRGGRVSKTSAVMGTMLGIKPMLNVNNEGHLIARQKVRGRKAALLRLATWMEECTDLKHHEMVMISHGDCLEDAEYVRDQVKARFQVDQFMIHSIGAVIGSHSGPGTVALFFWGKDRQL